MKAAIYCRLSKEDEECSGEQDTGKRKESESIQNQKSMLLEYAMEHGFDIYNIYSDEDYSGVDRDRPAFNAMLEAASRHEFDIILAKTQSRFTRDMELVEKYLHGKFIEWGIRFIAVVDRVDTNDLANKKSRQINGLVNEWYLEDLSNNVRSVLLHKRKEGRYIAAFALYGYRKDPLDKNHMVIDAEAAEVVRRIFSLCLSGCGATRIAETLNAENVPNPSTYKRRHGSRYVNANSGAAGLWSRATIYGMLRNESYMGNLVQGRHKKLSYKSKKTVTLPQCDWIVVPHTHEPIVDRESFDRVQKMLALRCHSGKNGMVHPLGGKVRCSVCGAVMERTGSGAVNGAGGRRMYFRCRTHTRKQDACVRNGIGAEEVERVVLERIQAHLAEWFDAALTARPQLKTDPDGAARAKRAELERLRREEKRYMDALRALYLDRSSGLIDAAGFAELNAALREEKDGFQRSAQKLEADLSDSAKKADEAEDWPETVRRILEVRALPRALAVLLVKSVFITPKGAAPAVREIRIVWNF